MVLNMSTAEVNAKLAEKMNFFHILMKQLVVLND